MDLNAQILKFVESIYEVHPNISDKILDQATHVFLGGAYSMLEIIVDAAKNDRLTGKFLDDLNTECLDRLSYFNKETVH